MAALTRVAFSREAYEIFNFIKEEKEYTLWEMNGEIFAIYQRGICVQGGIELDLKDFNVVMLASFKASKEISIRGKSVIILDDLHSDEGKISIIAQNKYIRFDKEKSSTNSIKSKQSIQIEAESAIRIFHPETNDIEFIHSHFQIGYENKDGNATKEAIHRIVKIALEYSDVELNQDVDFFDVFCEYLNIPVPHESHLGN